MTSFFVRFFTLVIIIGAVTFATYDGQKPSTFAVIFIIFFGMFRYFWGIAFLIAGIAGIADKDDFNKLCGFICCGAGLFGLFATAFI